MVRIWVRNHQPSPEISWVRDEKIPFATSSDWHVVTLKGHCWWLCLWTKKTLKHFGFGDMIHGDFLGYIGEYHGGIIWGYIGIYDQQYSINIYGLWVWLKIGYPIPLVASWSPVFHGHSCVTPHNSSHGNDAPYFKPGNHRNMMLEITTVWTKLCHSTPHPISEISKIPYGLWEIKATPQALKETVTSKSLHELWLIFSSPKAPPEKQKKWIVQAIFSV